MAPKRSRPLDDPPSPTSTSNDYSSEEEEEEEVETQLQIPTKQQQQQPESEEEEEDPLEEEVEEEVEEEEVEEEVEEEESDDDESPLKTNYQVQTSAATKKKNPEPESDAETESDSDSHPSQKACDYTVKPIVSKPVKESETPVKKSESLKAKGKVEKVAKPEKAKRSNAEEEDEDNGVGTEKKTGAAVTRKWSFEDEIKILQGMIDFLKKYGYDAWSNHDEFYKYVKDSVKAEFSKTQVMDKVRRLKRKYKNNLSKHGNNPEISNPHENQSFKLSKKIWGNLDGKSGISNVNVNVDAHANVVALPMPTADNAVNGSNNHLKATGSRSAKKSRSTPAVSADNDVGNDENMMEVEEEENEKVETGELIKGKQDFAELYPNLMKAFEPDNMVKVPLLDGLKSCLSRVGGSKLEEWDRKWKLVQMAETEAYLQRLTLIQEQTSWFSNAMK